MVGKILIHDEEFGSFNRLFNLVAAVFSLRRQSKAPFFPILVRLGLHQDKADTIVDAAVKLFRRHVTVSVPV